MSQNEYQIPADLLATIRVSEKTISSLLYILRTSSTYEKPPTAEDVIAASLQMSRSAQDLYEACNALVAHASIVGIENETPAEQGEAAARAENEDYRDPFEEE